MPENRTTEPAFDPDVLTPRDASSLVASVFRIFKGLVESGAFIVANWLVTLLVTATEQKDEWWVPILNNGLTALAVITMLVVLGIECLTLIQAKLRAYKQSQGVSR